MFKAIYVQLSIDSDVKYPVEGNQSIETWKNCQTKVLE